MVNLQQQITGLSAANAESAQSVQKAYSSYMSTPGIYGTMVELCAMAELFDFGFYIVRKNDSENYTCFDYGSFENRTDRPAFHLLFTGDICRGHFSLLRPIGMRCPQVELGEYSLVKDFSSSRMTSITHKSHKASLAEEQSERMDTENLCEKEKNETFEDFILLIARCRRNIRVLKRVPRGARIVAATKLTKCIQDCLAAPHLDSKWKKLLTFAYASLRVPETVKNKSLASMVKKNIERAELVFPKPTKKKETDFNFKESRI